MRWILAAAALALCATPLAHGQSVDDLSGEDATGDVDVMLSDGTGLTQTEDAPYLDIASGRITKEGESLRFALGVADPSALYDRNGQADIGEVLADILDDPGFAIGHTSVYLHFTFRDLQYAIDYYEEEAGQACLGRTLGSQDGWERILCADAEVVEDRIEVVFPAASITGPGGEAISHPAEVNEVYASSYQYLLLVDDQFGRLELRDRAPDEGAWGDLVTTAPAIDDPLLLEPVAPQRLSNGGPDLMVFPVMVRNLMDHPMEVLLEVSGLPEGWRGQVPARLELGPAEDREVPVVVTLPSRHIHGGTVSFELTAATDMHGFSASVPLSISFLETPQPTAHHPTLYLHSGLDSVTGNTVHWMSTNPFEEEDLGGRVSNYGGVVRDYAGTQEHMAWFFDVDRHRGLAVGLDFDPSQPVVVSIPIDFDGPAPMDIDLTFSLKHCDPNDPDGDQLIYPGDLGCTGSWHDLAAHSEPVSLQPGEQFFDWELPVTDYADLVLPEEGAKLYFFVEVTRNVAWTFVEYAGVDELSGIYVLVEDSRIELPLLEFRDPRADAFAAIGSLLFEAQGAAQFDGAPGTSPWIALDLTNTGESTRDLTLGINGHRSTWATVEPTEVRLAAGQTTEVVVSFAIPTGTPPGDFADIFVVAEDKDDPSVLAIQRLRLSVVDGSMLSAESKDRLALSAPDVSSKTEASPAPATLTLPLIAIAALIARRNLDRRP